ncbi:MAG: DNA primase [Peptococcaceae bacterium]|nr:DNA primase [Peptococcaceae bacterium]
MPGSTGRIPQEVLDEIITRADIVDVVGRYVPLKKQGQNFIGLCPFHNEKTPSFSVSQNKQIFHCFGCGKGGNVFKFLMEIEHLTFPEAVRKIADEVGVALPVREQSAAEKKAQEKRSRLLKWNKFAAFYYQAVLHSDKGKLYRDYLEKRQLSAEIQERFQLGGCLEGWSGLYQYLKKKGAPDEDLVELGLVSPRKTGGYYDRFRDRLMFPIKDASGNIIAFGGRIIDAEKAPQKYINSSDTPIFHKGRNVYGLDASKSQIRGRDQVMIVEGYMDVLACHQAGLTNAVAPLGTALTEEQVKMLMRYTYNFVLSFDGDGAGVRAALKGCDLVEAAGGRVKVLEIPDNKDPDEYIKAYGVEAFQKLIDQAANGYIFRIHQWQKQHPGDTMDDKLAILNQALPYLARMRHSAALEMAIRQTAEALLLSEEAIRNELNHFRRSGARRQNVREQYNPAPESPQPPKPVVYPKNEIVLLAGLMKQPNLCEMVEEGGGKKLFASRLAEVYEAFVVQYAEEQQISASRLEVSLSSLLAAAMMQADEDVAELETTDKLANIMKETVMAQQYQIINKRYQAQLNAIGSLEKGGYSEDMKQALMELESLRQQKKQFEERMRGNQQ